MKFLTRKPLPILLCMLPLLAQPAQASGQIPMACMDAQLLAKRGGGAGGGNGGMLEELNQKAKLLRIGTFLSSPVGRKAFPEINPEFFQIVAKNLHFSFTDAEVRDHFGNLRTCAWDDTNCSVTCNQVNFESETLEKGVENAILAHEVFGLLGYERGDENIPSPTHFSDRLLSLAPELEKVELGRAFTSNGKAYVSIRRPYHVETMSTFSANQRDKGQFNPSLDGVCRYFGFAGTVENSQVWRPTSRLRRDAKELGLALSFSKWSIMTSDGEIAFQRDIVYDEGASYLFEIVCWK